MKPQTVLIYGRACSLQQTGGGRVTSYSVTDAKTGAVLTQQASRFLAVAKAAEALRRSA